LRHKSTKLTLRGRLQQIIGAYRLEQARQREDVGDEAYELEYRSPDGGEVKYSLAAYGSPAVADRQMKKRGTARAKGERSWRTGKIVSAAAGNPRDVQRFCGDIPVDLRPDYRPEFSHAISKALPASWQNETTKTGIKFVDKDGAANILGLREPFTGSSRSYAQLNQNVLESEISTYQELDKLKEIDLGPNRRAFRVAYAWTSDATPVVQFQVYFVECGIGYVFTSTARLAQARKSIPVLLKAIDGLKKVGG
jgi:hypothetical protein